MKVNKTVEHLTQHGDKYFERNFKQNSSMQKTKASELLVDWLTPFAKTDIFNMLEIGCGACNQLAYISNKLEIDGFGIEPSKKAIAYAAKKYPGLKLSHGTSNDLSIYKDSQFDFVHLGFFMYLVNREIYDHTISEVSRVLRNGGFLSKLDFATNEMIEKSYSHDKALKVIKNDQSKVFLKQKDYFLVNKFSFTHTQDFFAFDIDERLSLQLLFKKTRI